MKRAKYILTTLFALAVMAGVFPAYAADAETAVSSSYYPIAVEEYTYGDMDELRINKVYQLSLSNDPSLIPTEDFVRNGRLYYLLDMTRKDEVGVDTQPCTQAVTMASDTDDMEAILQKLDAEIEATTEDGYTGLLRLDHTSVQVTVDGYATKSRTVSATRTYPNLSDADLSLVPKTVTEGGRTLNLVDVKWSSATDTEGEDVVTRYTATASYTGSVSSRYVTGYTVTANYTGEVAKTSCEVVIYTAIFGCTDVPYINTAPTQEDGDPGGERQDGTTESNPPEDSSQVNGDTAADTAAPSGGAAALSIAGCAGGVAALLAAAYWGFEKIKERRSAT